MGGGGGWAGGAARLTAVLSSPVTWFLHQLPPPPPARKAAVSSGVMQTMPPDPATLAQAGLALRWPGCIAPTQDPKGPAPFLASPLWSRGHTHIDPTVLHRGRDGPEEPTPQAKALVVEVPHDLVAFAVDAGGTQGTRHQGQPPMDLGAKGRHSEDLGPSSLPSGPGSSNWR